MATSPLMIQDESHLKPHHTSSLGRPSMNGSHYDNLATRSPGDPPNSHRPPVADFYMKTMVGWSRTVDGAFWKHDTMPNH
ncbi:hypothetical protein NHX12_029570 [Muraenolepis orangiensis]|uniref:Uncharacterized protein n=1 Tax=Muraenolepis orangiensis TaxID=630683 RepID=A0A9Q0E7V9_9TELE|nr:hypothetical protein NHX12_029570 [Muraenolepis orangiensis]